MLPHFFKSQASNSRGLQFNFVYQNCVEPSDQLAAPHNFNSEIEMEPPERNVKKSHGFLRGPLIFFLTLPTLLTILPLLSPLLFLSLVELIYSTTNTSEVSMFLKVQRDGPNSDVSLLKNLINNFLLGHWSGFFC